MQRTRKTPPKGRRAAGHRASQGNIRSYAVASFGLVALALALLIGADFLGNSPEEVRSGAPRTVADRAALPRPGTGSPSEATPPTLDESGTRDDTAVAAADPSADPAATEAEAWAPNPSALQDKAQSLSRSPDKARHAATGSSGALSGSEAAYRRPAPQPSLPAARAKGTLVFVIDDIGHNLGQLEPFLRLPFPVTFAVLPGLPYSEEAARRVLAAGKELILHQPMEALGGQDPGPRAITLDMDPQAAARIVRSNLDAMPGAVGMNNHEGSAVTRDDALMTAIVGVAKKRGIYYLDSLTIPETATPVVAARAGIRYWERDVFLDNSPDRVSIVHYIDVGRKKAEKTGSAIMIGHVWSAELAQTLTELYPQLVAEGFSLSTISRVMIEDADAGPGD